MPRSRTQSPWRAPPRPRPPASPPKFAGGPYELGGGGGGSGGCGGVGGAGCASGGAPPWRGDVRSPSPVRHSHWASATGGMGAPGRGSSDWTFAHGSGGLAAPQGELRPSLGSGAAGSWSGACGGRSAAVPPPEPIAFAAAARPPSAARRTVSLVREPTASVSPGRPGLSGGGGDWRPLRDRSEPMSFLAGPPSMSYLAGAQAPAPSGDSRAASFMRLNRFLLKTHITSLLAALAEDGWIQQREKEMLSCKAREDSRPWTSSFVRVYMRFLETENVQFFVNDLRALLI